MAIPFKTTRKSIRFSAQTEMINFKKERSNFRKRRPASVSHSICEESYLKARPVRDGIDGGRFQWCNDEGDLKLSPMVADTPR